MYDPGKGIFNEVSGSLHNIPMHMQDNGRVAPQLITPGVSQIYNPAFNAMNMSRSALGDAASSYGGAMSPESYTGTKGFYQTQIHNADMYSTYTAEQAARGTRDSINIGKSVSTLAGISTMVMGASATQIWNPLGWAGMAVGAGLMAADYAMERGDSFYRGYQNRMADINGVRQVMKGAGTPGIMNAVTGRTSETGSMQYLSMLENTGIATGMSSSDMHGLNSMAAQSGMLQGHGGSLGQLGSRMRQLATVTKKIMDISSGISAQDAMELQRISESIDMSGSDFANMDIGKRLITAAKVSGKSIAQVGAIMTQGAAMSQSAGLGTVAGADIALFNDAFVSSSYGGLTAGQVKKVGSRDQFANTLNAAHNRFTQRNIHSIVGQSMFIDPTTGAFEIDDAAIGDLQVGRGAQRAALKRMKNLYSGDNATLLSASGISSNLVKSALQMNLNDLNAQAAQSLDPEQRMNLILRDAMVEAGRRKMDVRAVLVEQHGQAGADALMVQANQYEKSAATRTQTAQRQNMEYHAQIVARGKVYSGKGTATAAESHGRIAANITANLSERMKEEAVGVYRSSVGRDITLAQFDSSVDSRFSRSSNPVYGASSAARGYNTYRGAKAEMEMLREETEFHDIGGYEDYLEKLQEAPDFDETLMGKRFLTSLNKSQRFWSFDAGNKEGLAALLTNTFSNDLTDLSAEQIDEAEQYFTGNQDKIDIRYLKSRLGKAVGPALINAPKNISKRLRAQLKAKQDEGGMYEDITGQFVAGTMVAMREVNNQSITGLLSRANREVSAYSDLTEGEGGAANMSKLHTATSILAAYDSKEGGTLFEGGFTSGLKQVLLDSGFSEAQLEGEKGEKIRVAAIQAAKKNTNAQYTISEFATEAVGGPNPFSAPGSVFNAVDFNKVLWESSTRDTEKIRMNKSAGVGFWSVDWNDNREILSTKDFLYGQGSRQIETADQDDAKRRLLSLSKGVKLLGGRDAFKDIFSAATDQFARSADYNYAALEEMDDEEFFRHAGAGLDSKQKKKIRALLRSKDQQAITAARQALMNASRTDAMDRAGEEKVVGALDKLLDNAEGIKNQAALDNFIGMVKDSDYEGFLGVDADQVRKKMTVINEKGVGKRALAAFYGEGGSQTNYAKAYEALSLKLGDNLDETQKEELKKLFRDTVQRGGGSADSMEQFRAGLFKIMEGNAAGKGGAGGGKTAEDPTLTTIKSFNEMIAATAQVIKALTMTPEKAKGQLESAQSRLQALATSAKG